MEKATFAAGCFWGRQLDLDNVDGVFATRVGYTGGNVENPTYEQVCSGKTGHAEAVEIRFDPDIICFEQLLDVFWRFHDPTTLNRQGEDRGSQYRSAIFYHSSQQKKKAEKSRLACDVTDVYPNPIVTEITKADIFWPAEEYHQKYLSKRSVTISCH